VKPATHMSSLGEGKYLILGAPKDSWFLHCGRQPPRKVAVTTFGTITLPCDCSLRTPHYYILASLDLCNHTTKSDLSYESILNLMYLYSWFNQTHLESLNLKSLVETLPYIDPAPLLHFPAAHTEEIVEAKGAPALKETRQNDPIRHPHLSNLGKSLYEAQDNDQPWPNKS
jgi:hypothetical protein